MTKILHINCVYGVGSTGKIVRALHESLPKDGFDSAVLYGRGRAVDEPGVCKMCGDAYARVNGALSRLTGLRYAGCRASTARIIREIQRQHPDVVHLHCINGYFVNVYQLVAWLRDNGFFVVLTLHADFMFTANCSSALDCDKWESGCGGCPRLKQATKSLFFDRTSESADLLRAAFSGFGDRLRVVSVSPWLEKRAKCSYVLRSCNHSVVFNGVDVRVFNALACRNGASRLKERYAVGARKVVLHVTALFNAAEGDAKGGEHVLQLARRMAGYPVLFVIAGKSVDGHTSFPSNVVAIGEVRDQSALAQWYTAANVTLITSKQETFSMVCAESLCCGTPVVGFRAGGPESISLPAYSEFVEQGDVDALQDALLRWLDAKSALPQGDMQFAAAQVYSQEAMVERYEALYREASTACGA